MNQPDYDPWDEIQLSPSDSRDIYKNKSNPDPWDQVEYEESWGKNLLRTLYQIPSGIAQAYTYPLDLIQAMGIGEAYDPEDVENLKRISAREGIPFDEEKYNEAVKGAIEASQTLFPTQGNIERGIERTIGLPLTPKTKSQKGIKLASTAGKLTPGTLLQKGSAAATAPTVSHVLQESGVPETLSEMGGLLASQPASILTPKIGIGASKKPSGLTSRRFESIQKPTEVTKNRLGKINESLESDFRGITDKIIETSPVNKTYNSLKEDSLFKSKIGDLFQQVENKAESIPETFSSNIIRREISKKFKETGDKGLTPSDYDQSYQKIMKKFIKNTPVKEITAKELVSQYRLNNKSLSELYEPGKSKSFNRAKKDAFLDYNRIIAQIIEEKFPKSEFSDLFKFTNKRWSEIKDSESINKFLDDLFDGKIRYEKGQKLFAKDGVQDSFKRALGQDGFKNFEQLMKDLMSTKEAYSLLRKAEDKGFSDFAKTGLTYMLHPSLAKAKTGYDLTKAVYKALLDKPKLAITWDEGIRAAKKGNFSEAENKFSLINKEVQLAP